MKPPQAVFCTRCREVVSLNVESRCMRCDVEIDPLHEPRIVEVSANLDARVQLSG